MTKQKKSFFEKLTGIKKVTDEDTFEELDLHESPSGGFVTQFESQEEEMYEFPEQQEEEEPIQQQYIQKEPMQQLQQEFEQPIESEGQLTIDVYQTNDDIVIKSTIAGVKPENLDVNINNDMVTIRGERQQDEEISADSYYYQECYWGPFSRSVILPVEIIADKAEATMKNGILTLRLPKADTTKTRKIQVRGF